MTSGISPDDPDYQYLCVDRKKLMKEQTITFDGKKNCWVPHNKDGFTAAEKQSSKGDEITVYHNMYIHSGELISYGS
jgi:hypothetical protein